MENNKADGFQEIEEQSRELAQRALWVIEALPRPRNKDVETEGTLRRACQYVESLVTELRDIVRRVRGLEASLVTARATTAERDEAVASAAAAVADADMRVAAAEKLAAGADESIERYAELRSGLEADRARVQASMEQLASMLEAARKDSDVLAQKKSDMDKETRSLLEAKRAAEAVQWRKAEAEKDVRQLEKAKSGMHQGLLDEWDRLNDKRRILERDVGNYNEAAAEYSRLKTDTAKALLDEKARVGRRDETVARLQNDVRILKSENLEESSKVKERDRVIAEMKLNHERALAAELQARLAQAGAEVDATQKRAASEYQGLVQKLDEMRVSQYQTLGTFQEDTKGLKEAMVSATQAMAERTAASNSLQTDLSPNVRAVKTTVEQIDILSRQLHTMDEAYAARQRDEAARARKHMVELIHEIDSQTRQQHENELEEMRQRHEAQVAELLTAQAEELARVRRQHGKDLDSARREATESRLMADELWQQLERARVQPVSPDRREAQEAQGR